MKHANMLLQLRAIVVAVAVLFPASLTLAADEDYRIDVKGDVIEDRLLYSIGGGTVTGAPSSNYTPNSLGVGVSWKSNFMCGNMDIQSTISNQLNGLTNGFKNIMSDIISAATGAVASLPALIIQRANPGLYELLSNGILQARIDFDRSKLKCEELAKQMVDMAVGSEWGQLAGAQYFQEQVGNDKVDAVTAVEDYEEKKGNHGIAWIGGKRAGGQGQEPIRVTEDIVKVGYNSLHARSETGSGSVSDCKGGAVCSIWETPQDAADWAVRVLGESERTTCNENCEPVKSIPGVGLTPMIQEAYEEKLKVMEDLLKGDKITAENLRKVSSGMLPVTRRVIEALQEDPDQQILARRLVSETAMSSVLEKALALMRTLHAGARNPHVEEAKPAQEGVKQNIAALNEEIALLRLEMNIRKDLAVNTAHTIMERQITGAAVSGHIDSKDTNKSRLDQVNDGK